MRDVFEKIIEAGTMAPSGSNSQPWRFKVSENSIFVMALPEKDHAILNFRSRGTWIAHGALIENIRIAASAFGYDAEITAFPEKDKHPNLVARMTLIKSGITADPLYRFVSARATNRKAYEKVRLTEEQKKSLMNAVGDREMKSVRFILVEGDENLAVLGEALSVNEIVMLENPVFHRLFFKEIIWSEAEEKMKKTGLFIKTMELKPSQQFFLRFLRHWPVMKLASILGAARAIARENAAIYASASAIGALILRETADEDFIEAGRTLERIWLKATELGMSMHLITGVPFLWQRIHEHAHPQILTPEHTQLIERAYARIAALCAPAAGEIVPILFRVGFGGSPSGRSSRLSPVYVGGNI